ncbi:uncharacterized protein V6R79_015874 [Siganus canaliculatus]
MALGIHMPQLDGGLQKTGAALAGPGPGPGPEKPLMEPCLTLQRGVFNQCDCPALSLYVCVCLPLEPEGGLLMAAAVAAMVVVVMVMMMPTPPIPNTHPPTSPQLTPPTPRRTVRMGDVTHTSPPPSPLFTFFS